MHHRAVPRRRLGRAQPGGPVATVLPFFIYAIGMGTSILIISIVAALAGSTVVAGLRRRTPSIMRAAGWLMIVAGVYAFLYGLAEVLQQFGIDALGGVIDVTLKWQGSLARVVYDWGVPTVTVLAVLAAVAAVWILGRGESVLDASARLDLLLCLHVAHRDVAERDTGPVGERADTSTIDGARATIPLVPRPAMSVPSTPPSPPGVGRAAPTAFPRR